PADPGGSGEDRGSAIGRVGALAGAAPDKVGGESRGSSVAGAGGVRSGVRRASAQAGDSAPAAEPDRVATARGRLQRGRHGHGGCAGCSAALHSARKGTRGRENLSRRPCPKIVPGTSGRSNWPGRQQQPAKSRSALL